ncbi:MULTISPECIES: hypothetical protein [unclassified Rhizobium]|uniref:hypothetical protein n=1 Tax=unclassified Rhizobium TaxID=2613769 RepID=UPI000EA9BF57|nr:MULTISPECIES: hypothetical protein [unclassified Rhizobium]AYG68861.1 hypothetical protein CCGE531_22550 [Rhizobium sp. CCGE531]AYG75248.1 hypothetical protein CCGE532_22035 [Rhizobium sp. CCGE532]
MGEVIQFRPTSEHGKHRDAQARLERELLLPFANIGPAAKKRSGINSPDASPGATSKMSFPLNGIVIVLGSILVYALVISHVVGQPHYSARANFMPPAFVQN